jgi:hypothetical protein
VRESESGARLMSETEWSAGEGVGRGVSACAWGDGPRWAKSREGARERERGGESMGRNWPSREGDEVFPFFLFLLFFSLIPFLLYTNIHLYFLGAKMKYYV